MVTVKKRLTSLILLMLLALFVVLFCLFIYRSYTNAYQDILARIDSNSAPVIQEDVEEPVAVRGGGYVAESEIRAITNKVSYYSAGTTKNYYSQTTNESLGGSTGSGTEKPIDFDSLLSQYVSSKGRAGGQVISGGTGPNEGIVIHGTASDSKATSTVSLQPNGGNVGIGTFDASYLFTIKSGLAIESAPLGSELTSNTGWTSHNWTGNFENGFTHITGNTDPLSFSIGNTGANFYQVTFTVDVAVSSNSLTVTLGNSAPYDLYNGAPAGSTYSAGIRSVSNGPLVFTPANSFAGTITNISVKQITGTYNPTFAMQDSADGTGFEIRSSSSTLNNTFVGADAGRYNTTGSGNSALGNLALAYNTTGYWNSAIGHRALRDNTTGSRNIGIGFNTLSSNKTGMRNIGVGTFALPRNTSGNYNIAMGADALFYNTTGSSNIGIGFSSLGQNSTGNNNVALGYYAGAVNVGDSNIFLGFYAGRYETGSNKLIIDNLPRANESEARSSALIYGTSNLMPENQRLSLGGGGYVGVGTGAAGPTNLFDVYNPTQQNAFVNIASFRRQRVAGDGWGGLVIAGNGGGPTAGVIKIYASGSNSQSLSLGSAGDEIFVQRATGRVGIGNTTPTGALHIKAGAAGAGQAPLKFTSGTLLTNAEAGAIEFSTDTFYMSATNGTASTRRQAIPGVTTSGAAPTSTPLRVGDIYVDTVAKKVYIATGTSGSADWAVLN